MKFILAYFQPITIDYSEISGKSRNSQRKQMGPKNLDGKKLDDRKETEFTDNQYLLSQHLVWARKQISRNITQFIV